MINSVRSLRMLRKPLACTALSTLILVGGVKVLDADSEVISFETPRPLSELALRLEHAYGWRITYEDPPRFSPDELVNASRVGTFMIPRSIPLLVSFPKPTQKRSIDHVQWIMEKRHILDDLLAQSPLPMRLIHNGDYSHIVPTQMRNAKGEVVGFIPMLDTPISFAAGKRTLLGTVALILSEVSKARGIPIVMGTIPTNYFLQSEFLTDAENESARDVLMRIFEDASGWRTQAGGSEVRMTWALLYDANVRGYAFNAAIIAPVDEHQDNYTRKGAPDKQK